MMGRNRVAWVASTVGLLCGGLALASKDLAKHAAPARGTVDPQPWRQLNEAGRLSSSVPWVPEAVDRSAEEQASGTKDSIFLHDEEPTSGTIPKKLEEEEPEEQPMATVVASLLLGFTFLSVTILHLINWRDPNVRSYMYGMISKTISIFCAVLLIKATDTFLVEQVLRGHPPRGFGMCHHEEECKAEKVGIGMVLFVSLFVGVNMACHALPKGSKYLPVVEEIGGHLMAFAGVHFFGLLQHFWKEQMLGQIATLVFTAFILGLCLFASSRMRERIRRARSGGKEEEWLTASEKAENDAVAIILSFLTSQVLTFYVTGRLPRLEARSNHLRLRDAKQVRIMFEFSLFFLFILVLYGALLRRTRNKPQKSDPGEDRQTERFTELSQTYLAMVSAWTSLKVAHWIVRFGENDRHTSKVFAAGMVTVLAVIAIIVLDFIADRLDGDRKTKDDRCACIEDTAFSDAETSTGSEEESSQSHDNKEAACCAGTQQAPASRKRSVLEALDVALQPTKQVVNNDNLEKALRTMIVGLSLLVGLSWEKAYHAADESIVHGTRLKNHEVISYMCVALFNVIVVIPAWIRFIVPMAKMPLHAHEAMLKLEEDPAAAATLIQVTENLEDEQLAGVMVKVFKHRKRASTSFMKELQAFPNARDTL